MKPRNLHVPAMMVRKAGSHKKPYKALRREQNSKKIPLE